MKSLPLVFVSLTQPHWKTALAATRSFPSWAWPELRLDLFPDLDPAQAVQDLDGCCLVSYRRSKDGGQFPFREKQRMVRLTRALEAGPAWIDLEWELTLPEAWRSRLRNTGLLRSVHVEPGLFDLESRLEQLPEGEAFKWVGQALHASDGAHLRAPLSQARDQGLRLSAFLMGKNGRSTRWQCLEWGAHFTYAAPDDAPAAAPGQISLSELQGRIQSHPSLRSLLALRSTTPARNHMR